MDFRELVEVLWRRKIVIALVTVLALATAVGALRSVTREYQSTATLALNPSNARDDIFILSTINAVVPVYASAADARTTTDEAKSRLDGKLASISVHTFTDTPIIKISARDPSADLAQRSAQAVTDVLIDRVQKGEVGIPSVKLTEIDAPVKATSAIFPRPKLTLAIAFLMGIAFGIAAALLRENLTSKVETTEALAQLTGVPTFAEIPNEPAVARVRNPAELTTNPRLRALAVTMARAGARTVLVDADLRKGRIADLVLRRRSPGLIDVLKGMPVSEVVQRTSLEGLDVVGGGELEADPGELLMNEFPRVLRALEEEYDCVVIDTTPLTPVNDARVIASAAESVVIVASAESATRRQVRNAVERLRLISIAPTAVVLNHSRAARAKGYYGYVPPSEEPARRPRRGKRQPARS
jgi:receptor protein-tyrosine kinase